MPPLPYHAELNQPIRLAQGKTASTTEDMTDVVEAENTTATAGTTTTFAYSSNVQQTVQVEVDGDNGLNSPGSKERPAAAPSSPVARRQRDGRVLAAEAQVASYCVSHTAIRASNPQLRSYYIWHDNEGLHPMEIARLLRDPPLQTNTVVGYILDAISLQKLPFDSERLRNEVLSLVSKEIQERKYAKLVRQADESNSAP